MWNIMVIKALYVQCCGYYMMWFIIYNVAKMIIFVSCPSVICDFLSSNYAESAN